MPSVKDFSILSPPETVKMTEEAITTNTTNAASRTQNSFKKMSNCTQEHETTEATTRSTTNTTSPHPIGPFLEDQPEKKLVLDNETGVIPSVQDFSILTPPESVKMTVEAISTNTTNAASIPPLLRTSNPSPNKSLSLSSSCIGCACDWNGCACNWNYKAQDDDYVLFLSSQASFKVDLSTLIELGSSSNAKRTLMLSWVAAPAPIKRCCHVLGVVKGLVGIMDKGTVNLWNPLLNEVSEVSEGFSQVSCYCFWERTEGPFLMVCGNDSYTIYDFSTNCWEEGKSLPQHVRKNISTIFHQRGNGNNNKVYWLGAENLVVYDIGNHSFQILNLPTEEEEGPIEGNGNVYTTTQDSRWLMSSHGRLFFGWFRKVSGECRILMSGNGHEWTEFSTLQSSDPTLLPIWIDKEIMVMSVIQKGWIVKILMGKSIREIDVPPFSHAIYIERSELSPRTMMDVWKGVGGY